MKLDQLTEVKYDHGSKTLQRVLNYFDMSKRITYSPTGEEMRQFKPKAGIVVKVGSDIVGAVTIENERIWVDLAQSSAQNMYTEAEFLENIEIFELRKVL